MAGYLSSGLHRVPGYLPLQKPVSPGSIPVPNQAFGFWPQGQLAPNFFPPGHKSFNSFYYPDSAQVLYAGPGDEELVTENADWRIPIAFVAGIITGYIYFSGKVR